MMGRCKEFEELPAGAARDAEAETRWREHLAGCASCRRQEAVDALLRESSTAPVPRLSGGFDSHLRRRLERAAARRPVPVRRPAGLRPTALWVMAVYVTAAVAASLLVLTRLPWQSFAAPPGLGIVLGALALLSPLVLLDRVGVMRPPG